MNIEPTDDPQQLIIEAAKAAETLLPGLKERRQQLIAEINELTGKIGQLTAMAAMGKSQAEPESVQQGSCEAYVDEALKNLGRPVGVHALRSAIMQFTGKMWAISTLYGVLNAGTKVGKYHHEANCWTLKGQS